MGLIFSDWSGERAMDLQMREAILFLTRINTNLALIVIIFTIKERLCCRSVMFTWCCSYIFLWVHWIHRLLILKLYSGKPKKNTGNKCESDVQMVIF